jgi:DNA polymerase III epsilon subunit-like protein
MEIARLSVVGIDGRPVYDSLIQPENPIIDYNTRFSGLTERDFRRGEKGSSTSASGPPVKSLKEVQNDLMGFISASTIIVGHGLENDFRALMLVHTLVVDTSTLYPHFFGLPYRRSLKSLAKSYLKRDIQTGTHDSLEDARASLELVLCHVQAESERMSNALKGNKDTNAADYSQHSMSSQFLQLGNNNALLNASIGGMNSSGILFNNNAMNPGVLPHVSTQSSISQVSTFLPHRPGIK